MWHFVHIPKTGGQSIEAALGIPNCHETAAHIPRPRFAFVRHPADRLVSAWAYARQKGNLVRTDMTADALREFLASGHLVSMPQAHWLDAPVDFLGRFETLERDFSRVSDRKLPHLNAGERGPWPGHFNPETWALTRDFYRVDFERFGYEDVWLPTSS